MSLVLLGSLTSGDEKIVNLREQFGNQMFGKGHLSDLIMESPFVAPIVLHFANEHAPDPDTVFVGDGSCAVSLTPWSCPLTPEVHSVDRARQFLSSRADATEWLSRLSQKSLACNCNRPPDECWAWMLRVKIEETFGSTVDTDEQLTFDVADDDLDDEWTPEDDDILEQWYSSGQDEIGATTDNADAIPAHVPWPTSWVHLVQTVRGLQRPVFWELYSGRARLTGAFPDEGIECAPPIDAADNPEYNMLNAMFLALVVGLLGAHLVDLLHLAPPCFSFFSNSELMPSYTIEDKANAARNRRTRLEAGETGADWQRIGRDRSGASQGPARCR